MVTLQILVLSFLVRIQVAQLKRLSFEGRFFCVGLVWLVGERVAYGYCRVCCICLDASISQCTTLATASCPSRHFHPSLLSFLFGYLILTLRWLSRYYSDLLLDLWSALFL